MRMFLALPRDRMWMESARALLETVRRSLPDASWAREESWHVTLKFLGEIEEAQARAFASAIGPKALETIAGELPPGGPLLFPPRGPARVLGIGFGASPAFDSVAALASEAERIAREMGLPPETREFRPHVTLARIKHPWPRNKVEAWREATAVWNFPDWQARCAVLYESRLGRDGATHTPLEEWSFAGGPRGVRA
jgi:RNA 2',3'-cyclic 3'-phosphodiesterase